MKYYISDLHLGHANVIKHDGRPFADVEEMDRSLIKMWNDTVGDDDDIYIVGDFCYRSGKTADWYLSRLKGRKHLLATMTGRPSKTKKQWLCLSRLTRF